MSWVRVEFGEKVPQDQGLHPPGTHNDVLPRLLVADSVMQLLLHLKSIKELLYLWDEVDESSDNEDHDKEFPRPERGGYVTVADRAESHQHKPERVKQGYPLVNTFNVVEKAHPGMCPRVCVCVCVEKWERRKYSAESMINLIPSSSYPLTR